jgi:hypothetical protein
MIDRCTNNKQMYCTFKVKAHWQSIRYLVQNIKEEMQDILAYAIIFQYPCISFTYIQLPDSIFNPLEIRRTYVNE